MKGDGMKTKQNLKKADEEEGRIRVKAEGEEKAAYLGFSEATKEEWEEYERVWRPAQERWEVFSQPYFEKLKGKLLAIEKAKSEALAEVRKDWKKCPKCGTLAARYQTYCTDDKCKVNLLPEKEKK